MTVRDAFAQQAKACAGLGSPFMGRLMALAGQRLTDQSQVGARILSWPGDVGPGGDSVPLRLAGALHALLLRENAVLAAVYPPNDPSDDALWAAVEKTLDDHSEAIGRWLNSPPQTNEVRRSATLIPVGVLLGQRFGLPLVLSEVGASAGLNLMFDRFGLETRSGRLGATPPALLLRPDWSGPLPTGNFTVADRRGVDLAPIDATSEDGQLRLMAYLWPDQPHRLELTRSALSVFGATVDAADALAWLPGRLTPRHGFCHMIFSTVAWQYLPKADRDAGASMIETAGKAATEDAPLAWFRMENDGEMAGATLTLRLWPGDLTVNLGRADFHGRWVTWSEEGVRLP